MKLELHHMAPYLPYGLKMRTETGNGTPEDYHVKDNLLTPTFLTTCLNADIYRRISCKPILKPMGDSLSKMLNIDGEDIFFNTWVSRKTGGIEIDYQLDFEIEVGNNSRGDTLYFPLNNAIKAYNLLLEYHFDVFNLIPAGLAIPL